MIVIRNHISNQIPLWLQTIQNKRYHKLNSLFDLVLIYSNNGLNEITITIQIRTDFVGLRLWLQSSHSKWTVLVYCYIWISWNIAAAKHIHAHNVCVVLLGFFLLKFILTGMFFWLGFFLLSLFHRDLFPQGFFRPPFLYT